MVSEAYTARPKLSEITVQTVTVSFQGAGTWKCLSWALHGDHLWNSGRIGKGKDARDHYLTERIDFVVEQGGDIHLES